MIAFWAALLSLLAYLSLLLPDSQEPRVLKFLLISQLLTLLYLVIVKYTARLTDEDRSRRIFWTLFAVGLAMRLVLFVGADNQTWLSDDVYRYVWEGKLTANGINPYYYSPEDLECSELVDTTIYPLINHPELPAIYPPVAQYIFAVSYLIGGDSIAGFRKIAFLFELLTLLAVFLLARGLGKTNAFFIYLFSPLILIEFIYSNHLDIIALPFFVTAIICLQQKRPFISGLLLALAVLTKLNGLIFAPVFFFFFKGREKMEFSAAFILTTLALYLPFLVMPEREIFGSLWAYMETWQWNGSIYPLVKSIVGDQTARIVTGIAAFSLVLWVSLTSRLSDPIHRLFWVAAIYIMLSPSVFPWYMAWMIPLLVVVPNRPFLLLTGTIFLSYHVLIGYYTTGEWITHWQLTLLEYMPFYILLALPLVKRATSSRSVIR